MTESGNRFSPNFRDEGLDGEENKPMMRNLLVIALSVCLSVIWTAAAVAQTDPPASTDLTTLEEQSFREATALLNASIVQIQTVGGLDRVGGVSAGTAPTTGVVVSADGLIISSAFNFASRPSSVLVTTPDNRRFPATIVASDRSRKITLLKIDAEGLVPVQAVPSDEIRVGQWAVALGRTYTNAFPSVSIGIVSAVNRVWGRAIQTDAKVSPVNYGGPLAAIDGRVLGLLVAMSPRGDEETAGVEWYDSGIGFAVPMVDVLESVERMRDGTDLYPGKLGIKLDLKDQFAPPVIKSVSPESPADEAGIEVDDLIVSVAGTPVSRVSEVKFLLGPMYAGEDVAVAVRRGDETLERTIKLVAEVPEYRFPWLGILPDRSMLGTEPQGVGVRLVFESSPAAAAGLKPGDMIQAINGQPVRRADQLRELITGQSIDTEIELTGVRNGEPFTGRCRLGELQTQIPADLSSVAVPPGPAAPADAPQRGRFTFDMQAHDHSCWAYVPEDYHPDHLYGLLVWIHPSGDTMEATIMRQWKAECDRRGIMILAPKAAGPGWIANESEFVRDAVREFMQKYPIDPQRVFVHSIGSGGPLAFEFATREREWFRGIALCSSSIASQVPENDPSYRTQIYLHWGSANPLNETLQKLVEALKGLGYPVTGQQANGQGDKYPQDDELRKLARWADSLDRI